MNTSVSESTPAATAKPAAKPASKSAAATKPTAKPAAKPADKDATAKVAKPSVNLDPLEGEEAVAGTPSADTPAVTETASTDTQESSDPIGDALTRVAAPANAESSVVEPVDDSSQITIPPTFEYVENVPNTFNGTAFEIRLYGEGCLNCGHLVPSEKHKENACHFSNKNPYCPAAFTRVVFVGERMNHVSRIRKAMASGDSNRLLNRLAELEACDLETKNFVLREVGLLSTQG